MVNFAAVNSVICRPPNGSTPCIAGVVGAVVTPLGLGHTRRTCANSGIHHYNLYARFLCSRARPSARDDRVYCIQHYNVINQTLLNDPQDIF